MEIVGAIIMLTCAWVFFERAHDESDPARIAKLDYCCSCFALGMASVFVYRALG